MRATAAGLFADLTDEELGQGVEIDAKIRQFATTRMVLRICGPRNGGGSSIFRHPA